jgi:hypothetical protein
VTGGLTREFVGTLSVLLALTSMSHLPAPELFNDGMSTCEMPSAAEEPTRLTIRMEAASSRWRTMRWWTGVVVAVAAAVVGVRQVDSRSSHHARRPESKVVGGGRIVPNGGSRSTHQAGPTFARHHHARSATHSSLSRRRLRHRARAIVGQRAVGVDGSRVSTGAPESPVKPDVDDPRRPSEPNSVGNVGQFSYLGG